MDGITTILNYLQGKLAQKELLAFELKLKEDTLFAQEVALVQEDWNRQRLSDWLDGDLSGEEVEALKKDLEASEALRQELEQLKEAKQVLAAAHRNTILKDIDKIAAAPPKVVPLKRNRSWLRVASILFLVAALALYFLVLPSQFSNTALLAQYHEPYPSSGNLLGIDQEARPNTFYKAGIRFYDQKNYAKAIEQLQQVPNNSTYYLSGQFYLANAYLAKQEATQAVPIFTQLLSNDLDASEQSRLQWYLALSHLAADQEELAKQQLSQLSENEADLFYQRKAQGLLKQLNGFWRKLF